MMHWLFPSDTEEEPEERVGLEESMWGVVILIGTDPMGFAASVLLTILFVMNISMQERRYVGPLV